MKISTATRTAVARNSELSPFPFSAFAARFARKMPTIMTTMPTMMFPPKTRKAASSAASSVKPSSSQPDIAANSMIAANVSLPTTADGLTALSLFGAKPSAATSRSKPKPSNSCATIPAATPPTMKAARISTPAPITLPVAFRIISKKRETELVSASICSAFSAEITTGIATST